MNIIEFSKHFIYKELANPNRITSQTELLDMQRTLNCIHSENVAKAYLEICSKRKSICNNDYISIASSILETYKQLDELNINDRLLEIDNAIQDAYTYHPELKTSVRLGQRIFSNCYCISFLSNYIDTEIRGTNKDCFYNDANINKFINAITDYTIWNLKQERNIIFLMMVKYQSQDTILLK